MKKLETSKFVNSAEEFLKKYEKLSKACDDMDMDDKFSQLGSYIQDLNSAMRWLQSDMNYLYSVLGSHFEGHLPPCSSPSQMKGALKALGLDEDYDVAKKVIYANDGRRSEIVLNFSPKKS